MSAFVGLGSNLGDRQANLRASLSALAALPSVGVRRVSSLYETAPVGVTEQPPFLNAAAEVQTTLSATALLGALLNIENQMGRVRTFRWGPRVIDLDLLVYGSERVALPDLTVPHPRLCERGFVLVPLAEIAPEMTLPGHEKTIGEMAAFFSGDGNIRRLGFV